MRRVAKPAAFAFLAALAAVAVFAGPAAKLPPGVGRYIMVLQLPGTGPNPVKHVIEPDVTKLGGKVLNQHDNERVIELPVAAAQQLRSDVNVAFLQRVWMGEPLDKWDERPAPSKTPSRRMTTNSETNLTWSTGTFGYDGSGNIKAMGADTYVYDSVGRIVQATLNGVTETYAYDSFGNLTQKTIAGDPLSVPIPPIDSSTNRLVRESYDVAGNVTSNGFKNSYVYDAVGMMALNMTMLGQNRRMIYTADDERIGIQIDSSSTQWEIRDINGSQVLREFTGPTVGFQYRSWLWKKDWIYAEGKLVAGEAVEGGQRHYSLDHLGSVRMVTNDAKMRYGRHDYYPFGREQTVSIQEAVNFGSGVPRNDRMKFAGHERDFNGPQGVENTDYLDYMHARFYDPNQGRFLAPDPHQRRAATSEPLAWNRYSYARNNPIALVDPDGRDERISWIFRSFGGTLEHLSKAAAAFVRIPVAKVAAAVSTGSEAEFGPLHARVGADVQLKRNMVTGDVSVAANAQATGGFKDRQIGQRLTATVGLPSMEPTVTASAAGTKTDDQPLPVNGAGRIGTDFVVSLSGSFEIVRVELGVNFSAIWEAYEEGAATLGYVVDETNAVAARATSDEEVNTPP